VSGARAEPYLSIIITSRNDEHGGNTLPRMQVSLSGLLEQLEKHKIESELILVEWNPPPDKPPLRHILKWPAQLKYCTVRNIIVPQTIHQRYDYSDKTPMNAVVAVNCGIKRARGEFILPGVIDLLYPDELVAFIAKKNLNKNERYRVDRCDVDRSVIRFQTLREQLDFCRNNIIRINAQSPSRKRKWFVAQRNLPELHTNACGDFQLMSRYAWHLLRGYREDDIIGAHVDGILSYASYAAGIKEVVLKNPMCVYHIDHDDKFKDRITRADLPLQKWLSIPFMPSWMNKKIIGLYRVLLVFMGYKIKRRVHGVPTLANNEYQRIVKNIVNGKRSYILNDENWGLDNESLEEFIINIADWDKQHEKAVQF